MEMQFFVRPGTEMDWYTYWKETRMKWHQSLGFGENNYRFHDHIKLAHYANAACDIEFNFPFGFKELEGIHSRTDYDLNSHIEASGQKLQYFDQASGTTYVPYVIEPSFGLTRAMMAFLVDAYREEEVRGEKRVLLALNPELAPYKVAVLPLLKKRDDLVERAHAIRDGLAKEFPAVYDDTAAIGKLYRRQDEIGTPWCVTIDFDTIEKDGSFTLRERDSMQQRRITEAELFALLEEKVY